MRTAGRTPAGSPIFVWPWTPPASRSSDLNARRRRLGPSDRVFDILASGKGDAHAPVLEHLGLGEDAQVDGVARRTKRKRIGNPLISEFVTFTVGKDHRRRG